MPSGSPLPRHPEEPPGGPSPPAGRRWTGRARGGRLGNLFFAVLARRGALGPARFFIFWVALYFLAAAPAARRASMDLARRLGAGRTRWRRLAFAFRHFFTYGTLLFDRAAILSGHRGLYRFELHGEEHIRRVLEGGRGAVIVTAHLGSWELLGQILGDLGATVHLVMHDGVQPELRGTLERLGEGRNFRVLVTDGTAATAARVLAALRRGEIVGMMGDRMLGERGVTAPLLGSPARLPAGPYALCAASGAPLVTAFALREGPRRYSVHASAPERLEPLDREGARGVIEASVERFAGRLESFLRRYPAQWGNFFSFWEDEGMEAQAGGGDG